ncbi:MAG TPA: NAD(+) diphosphatase, partial [Marinobacter adhaerens]|nr:NAD(+) diphosphatase [Marinobacter adhaerens]
MVIAMTQWIPGWTTRRPENGDLILALSGSGVVRPDNGWLQRGDSRLFRGSGEGG